MSEKKLIILRGVSGSGKSTLAKKLAEEHEGEVAICSADHHFIDSRGVYNFDVSQLGAAHVACFKKAMDSMMIGVGLVIIDNTNTRRAEYSPYVMLARANGYEVELHQIEGADVDVCADRNVHGVPDHAIKAQQDRMEKPNKWVDPKQVVYEFA